MSIERLTITRRGAITAAAGAAAGIATSGAFGTGVQAATATSGAAGPSHYRFTSVTSR